MKIKAIVLILLVIGFLILGIGLKTENNKEKIVETNIGNKVVNDTRNISEDIISETISPEESYRFQYERKTEMEQENIVSHYPHYYNFEDQKVEALIN